MRRKIVFASLFLAVLSVTVFFLSACGDIAMAYVEYKPQGDEYVLYASEESSSFGHIYVFEDASKAPDGTGYSDMTGFTAACTGASILYISFKRNLGVATVNGKPVSTVDIDKWNEMKVYISEAYYAENKSLFLNGAKLTPDSVENRVLTFRDKNFIKGNGSTVVNSIEYK